MSHPAIFLDKDGTLVENVPYNVDPAQVRLMAGTADGLLSLQEAGYRLVIVSNQSGVARGYFPESALDLIEDRLRDLLGAFGITLDGWYCCPHHPQGTVKAYAVACDCRKPKPGLLVRAARDLSLDLSRSWMIGDSQSDVEAGQRAGCRAVWVGSEIPQTGDGADPFCFVTRDFTETVRVILTHDHRSRPLVA